MSNGKKIPLGISMYSIKEEIITDLEGTLEKVKSFGYDGIEFQGMPIKTAGYMSQLLKDNGLDCISWHFPSYEMLFGKGEDNFKQIAEYLQELNIKYAIVTVFPGSWYSSEDAVKEAVEKINSYCDMLKPYGIRLGAHNHWEEFHLDQHAGKTGWQMLAEMSPDDFVMELDPGNAARGDADLIGELENDARLGKAQLMHIKPYSFANHFETIVCNIDDVCDYKSMLEICRQADTEYIFVEYQNKSMFFDDMDGIRVTIDRLRSRFSEYI